MSALKLFPSSLVKFFKPTLIKTEQDKQCTDAMIFFIHIQIRFSVSSSHL